MYISLRHQELRSFKKIGYEFYSEKPFIVKHKSSYSCESAIYFNLTMDIIKNSCNFDFYFNNTNITPTVLDGGDEIVLANWPTDKHIICNINNNIPVKILSHPCEGTRWVVGWYMILLQFLDNSDSPSIVEQ